MLSVAFVTIFLFSIVAASFTGQLPVLVPALYLVASVVTFAVYASDKSAARNGEWRTRERTLHLLSLIGGWPGGVVAQRVLRHKSKKGKFRVVFAATVLINCAAFVYLSFMRR